MWFIQPVLRNVSRWILIGLLALTVGGQWFILQSAAWAGMIVSYSKSATLTEAIGKTFDGQHPCPLCKFVARSQGHEKKQEMQQPPKADFFLNAVFVVRFGLRPFAGHPPAQVLVLARCEAPPLPPPRAV